MKIALTIIGVLLILAGVVWFFQGIGLLAGSMMTGQPMWTYIGGALVIVGIVLIAFAFRRKSTPTK
jgi:uncharacterized membrane protein HdeD (DUF308 family)